MKYYQLRQKHVLDQLVASWFDPQKDAQLAVTDLLRRCYILFDEEEYANILKGLELYSTQEEVGVVVEWKGKTMQKRWRDLDTKTLLELQEEMRGQLWATEHTNDLTCAFFAEPIPVSDICSALLIIGQILEQRAKHE